MRHGANNGHGDDPQAEGRNPCLFEQASQPSMKKLKKTAEDVERRKAEIRKQYQGEGRDEIELIPAKPRDNPFDGTSKKRVAVYARVSTGDERQTSSMELQKSHYTDLVKNHENWELVKIYADEGISGTSREKREAFKEMMQDCRDKKIDLVVTKSVSRFSRNVTECLDSVRELASMRPPVGVFFEMEAIYTLDIKDYMTLNFHSMSAEHDSQVKSNLMNDSVEKRFRLANFLTPPPLGYDRDKEKKLVINEEEADTVRLIFFLCLGGHSCQQIAEELTKHGRATKLENTQWNPGSVRGILQNERYCGDVLARKTWTPSFLDHKSRKNKNDRNQYRKRDHHEAIVSREDFMAVQQIIKNTKHGHKGLPPKLQVVTGGALRGFVEINPRWGGFTVGDYKAASASVGEKAARLLPTPVKKIEAQAGDLDLRGFQVAREELFHASDKPRAAFSNMDVKFTAGCLRKFDGAEYVEMLFHPEKQLLAVRPSSGDSLNAVKWAGKTGKGWSSRRISGRAWLGALYEMCGWDFDVKFHVRGDFEEHDNEAVLVFNLRGAEVAAPCGKNAADTWERDAPDTFNFGSDFYRHALEQDSVLRDTGEPWAVSAKGLPYDGSTRLNTTNAKAIPGQIKKLIRDMKQQKGKRKHGKKV